MKLISLHKQISEEAARIRSIGKSIRPEAAKPEPAIAPDHTIQEAKKHRKVEVEPTGETEHEFAVSQIHSSEHHKHASSKIRHYD